MQAELTSSMSVRGKYISLRFSTVKIHLDMKEAYREQHESLCKRLKAKKVILHTILLGVGGSIYTSHTLNHLEEIDLNTQKTLRQLLRIDCANRGYPALCRHHGGSTASTRPQRHKKRFLEHV